jgi:hypothetical protein
VPHDYYHHHGGRDSSGSKGDGLKAFRLLPQAAGVYRDAVCNPMRRSASRRTELKRVCEKAVAGGPPVALFAAASAPENVVAGACYVLIYQISG